MIDGQAHVLILDKTERSVRLKFVWVRSFIFDSSYPRPAECRWN